MQNLHKKWRTKILDNSSLTKNVDSVLLSRGINHCWWNSSFRNKSATLWLPDMKKCVECDSSINSWFSILKKHQNHSISSISTSVFSFSDNTDGVCTKIKTIKIRIYPTIEEKEKMKEMFEAYRWSYNAVVDIIKGTSEQEFKTLFLGKSVSCFKVEEFVKKYKYIETETEKYFEKGEFSSFPFPPWMEKVHCRIPRGAVKNYTGNINSAISNKKVGNIKEYNMKPKLKKSLIEECLFSDNHYPSWINKMKGGMKKGRKTTKLWSDIQKTHKKGLVIIHDKIKNKYYLMLPVETSTSPKSNIEKQDIISLDTGVRTFQTGYSPTGDVIEIGKDDSKKLSRLLLKTDRLAKMYKKEGTMKWYKKRMFLFTKIKNLVNELHWKTIKYLTSSYSTIIIPDFRISGMVRGCKMSRMTKRLLYIFSYFKFKTRLLWKAKLEGVKVAVVDESYTSMTCGRCGWQNKSLAGKKTFCCDKCHLVIDRDYNGARNILLKHMK